VEYYITSYYYNKIVIVKHIKIKINITIRVKNITYDTKIDK